MGKPKISELETIGTIKKEHVSGDHRDTDAYVTFYRHKKTGNMHFIDNPGYEHYGNENYENLEEYKGKITANELKKMLPLLDYEAAHKLMYG